MSTGILVLIVTLFGVGLTGGFYVGLERGEASGYKRGKQELQIEVDRLQTQIAGMPSYLEDFTKLQTDYNDLVKDYNALLEYANTPQYQPRQPLHCTSMDYGVYDQFTSINCY